MERSGENKKAVNRHGNFGGEAPADWPARRGLFLFNLENFTALVVAAVRANSMGQAHMAAVGALSQVFCLKRIMCAASIAAAFGSFLLGKGCHFCSPDFKSTGSKIDPG